MQSILRQLGVTLRAALVALTSTVAVANEAAKAASAQSVDTSIGAGSLLTTLASLGAVIVTILVFAAFAKRYSLNRASPGNALHTVASLTIGPRERVVVVEFRDRQLVLGATTQQITLLASLDKPQSVSTPSNAPSESDATPASADALVRKWVAKLTDRPN